MILPTFVLEKSFKWTVVIKNDRIAILVQRLEKLYKDAKLRSIFKNKVYLLLISVSTFNRQTLIRKIRNKRQQEKTLENSSG